MLRTLFVTLVVFLAIANPAAAGFFGTPTGGWGFDRPDLPKPPPNPPTPER